MISMTAALTRLWALAWFAGGVASACPSDAPGVILHSCAGPVVASVLTPPIPPIDAPDIGTRLIVTGGYTAEPDGGPASPVGLFVHGGRVMNPNLARMDGILVIDAAGAVSLNHRRRVPTASGPADLTDPAERAAFARAAAARGESVLQSHLLIVDGAVDVRPRADAPRFTRRILFTDANGFGIWQSPGPLTLHDAAAALARAHRPRMALNLDMGSYDYCWALSAGRAERCGLRPLGDTGRFSNLLVFERKTPR